MSEEEIYNKLIEINTQLSIIYNRLDKMDKSLNVAIQKLDMMNNSIDIISQDTKTTTLTSIKLSGHIDFIEKTYYGLEYPLELFKSVMQKFAKFSPISLGTNKVLALSNS